MQLSEHICKADCSVLCFRRVADEVIVVGEDGPSFQTPIEIGGELQQPILHNPQSFGLRKRCFRYVAAVTM